MLVAGGGAIGQAGSFTPMRARWDIAGQANGMITPSG